MCLSFESKWYLLVGLVLVLSFTAACGEDASEYDIHTGIQGEDPLRVSVDEMIDSMLIIGSDSEDREPVSSETKDLLQQQAQESGWNDYKIMFSHRLTTVHEPEYRYYFVMASYEEDGSPKMEAGLLGEWLSSDKEGTVEPDLRSFDYSTEEASVFVRPHFIRHMKVPPDGQFTFAMGTIVESEVERLVLEFAYGPRMHTIDEGGEWVFDPLGQFSKEIEADSHKHFFVVTTERHQPRGIPERGFPHNHINLIRWTAYDDDDEVVDSWSSPDLDRMK